MQAKLKFPAKYNSLKSATKISMRIMEELFSAIDIGVNRLEIDKFMGQLCTKYQVRPAFKGVKGAISDYEYNLCLGVNDDVVHAIPADYEFKNGDVISLDLGIIHQGIFTDHCVSFGLGDVSTEDVRLLETAKLAITNAAEKIAAGQRTGDNGARIQQLAELAGFSVVEEYIGHGIGNHLHLSPELPAYGVPGSGEILESGIIVCVEAQINAGSPRTSLQADGWTVKTADGKNSVMFEYMVHLPEKSKPAEILTDTREWPIVK